MSIENVLASVAVRDLDAAVTWYEKLLVMPASRPMPEVAEWRFPRGGGLQVYRLPVRAGSGSSPWRWPALRNRSLISRA